MAKNFKKIFEKRVDKWRYVWYIIDTITKEVNKMKNYTFMFWPDGHLMARITVKGDTRKDAENLIRLMIGKKFLDDGLVFVEEEEV